ncbi:MAG: pilus assembly FimT family protein [Planctomycetota bacterium]
MTHKKTKYKGYLFVELMVALTLISFMLTCMTISLTSFQRFNHYQLVRQRCTSAALAQIDCIELTGSELDNEVFTNIWPKIDTTVQRSSGTGQWQGLQLLEVSARSHSFDKEVTIKLSRYIATKGYSQ